MQSDESEKRRMNATEKNLFKNLTKRSEETLGAGASSEEDTSDKFVQEENDFVKVSSTHQQKLLGQVTYQILCFKLRTTKKRKDAENKVNFIFI